MGMQLVDVFSVFAKLWFSFDIVLHCWGMFSVVALICNAKIDYSSVTDSLSLGPVSILWQHLFPTFHTQCLWKPLSHLIIFKKYKKCYKENGWNCQAEDYPTLYNLSSLAAHRVLWTLEELAGTKYNVKNFWRQRPGFLAAKDLKAVFPLGKSPILTLEPSKAEKYPKVAKWHAVVLEGPAYKRALGAGERMSLLTSRMIS